MGRGLSELQKRILVYVKRESDKHDYWGKAEGKAEALVSLLSSRFGALPPSVRKQIREAKLASIERWFDRALNAHDLSSVFDPPR